MKKSDSLSIKRYTFSLLGFSIPLLITLIFVAKDDIFSNAGIFLLVWTVICILVNLLLGINLYKENKEATIKLGLRYYGIGIMFVLLILFLTYLEGNYNLSLLTKNIFTNKIVLIALLIIAIIALVIFIEIKIGAFIGKLVSKEAGLILGIVLIVLGVTLFIGIPIIIYSNPKKENIIFKEHAKDTDTQDSST